MKKPFIVFFVLFFMNTQACVTRSSSNITPVSPPIVAPDLTQSNAKWIKMGSDLFSDGLYKHAIEALNNAIEIDPQDASAYLLRGTAYYKLRQFNPTINDFNKAIELNPQDAAGYYCRGLAYDGLGNENQAIKDMKQAAKQNFKLAQDFLRNKGIQW
jgi:tetratricopeptide (TPR) repeat protein